MKIAIVVPDDRDELRRYDDPAPFFGTAVSALLQGFRETTEHEFHLVCCVRRPLRMPERVASNIYYHAALVPSWGWLKGAYLGCIRSVRRMLRRIQPDIVHGQGTERYCAMSAAFSGFPNLVTVHGNMIAIARHLGARFGSYHWFAARLEEVALARTRGVICNSTYTESMVRHRTPNTWRVANALDSLFFSPLLPPRPNRVPILMNVGTIIAYKRQLELLAVARELHAAGCRFELHFVGTGGDETYVREFQRQLSEAEQRGFARGLGHLNLQQLCAALDAADGLVHWSAEESFGLVAAEGLARNLKLFCARAGGLADIASGVEGAELHDPNDPRSLAASMQRWLNAGAPRPSTAAAEMRARYHPAHIAAEHLRVYREATTAQRAPARQFA